MIFDVPGRKGEMRAVMYHENREYVFHFPYETHDPVEIDLLSRHPTAKVVEPMPRPEPVETPAEKAQRKSTRKEV